jgi:hypothetical protein
MKEHQKEITNVRVYSLDHSSFFMLAISVVGTGAISNRLASHASVPPYWSDNEWTICFPLCVDHASRENSAWTRRKVKN